MLQCSECRKEVSRLDEKCSCGASTLMAIQVCAGCGTQTGRTRMVYAENHQLVREECDYCNPGSFDPRWKFERGAMGWEAYPNMYKKIAAPDGGTGYVATDEMRADTEAKIAKRPDDEVARERKALDEKARRRQAKPALSTTEIAAAINRWRPVIQEKRNRERAEEAGLELVN